MIFPTSNQKIIPISQLRKKFGDIELALPYVDYFVLTKKGKPFATLTATAEVKRNVIKRLAGSLRNTDLDNDTTWKEVFKKKSRLKSINL